jgi:hypothetical protein
MLILKRKDLGKSLEDIDKGKFRDVKPVTKYYVNCRKHGKGEGHPITYYEFTEGG